MTDKEIAELLTKPGLYSDAKILEARRVLAELKNAYDRVQAIIGYSPLSGNSIQAEIDKLDYYKDTEKDRPWIEYR